MSTLLKLLLVTVAVAALAPALPAAAQSPLDAQRWRTDRGHDAFVERDRERRDRTHERLQWEQQRWTGPRRPDRDRRPEPMPPIAAPSGGYGRGYGW